MDTEENRGPRSTEEAYAAHRGDVARRLLADPAALPQPWNEDRPGGWPIADAVFVYMPEVFRRDVSLQLGLRNEGVPSDTLERLKQSGWVYLRQRLLTGELFARGRDPSTGQIWVSEPDQFDDAKLDFDGNRLILPWVEIGSVRIFETRLSSRDKAVPASRLDAPVEVQPIGKGKGGRNPVHDWTRVAAEVVRIAHMEDLGNRRLLTARMYEWCALNLDTHPDESSVRKYILSICPEGLPAE